MKIIVISKDHLKKEINSLNEEIANKDKSNAFYHHDRGERDAIVDILEIMNNGKDKIKKAIKKKAKERFKYLNPTYSSSQDKASADSWYQMGYITKIKDVLQIKIKGKKEVTNA